MSTEIVRSKQGTISERFFSEILEMIGGIREFKNYKFETVLELERINARLNGEKIKEGKGGDAKDEQLPEPVTVSQKFQYIRNMLIDLKNREHSSNVLLEAEVKRLSEFV